MKLQSFSSPMRPLGSRVGRSGVALLLLLMLATALGGCRDRIEKHNAEARVAREKARQERKAKRRIPLEFSGVLFGISTRSKDKLKELPELGRVKIVGAPLETHLGYAYGFHPRDVEVHGEYDETIHYNARMRPEDGSIESAPALLRDELNRRFVLEVSEVKREDEAWILSRRPGEPLLQPSESTTGSDMQVKGGELRATRVKIADLVDFLRGNMELPVIDETELDATYDFVLQWDPARGSYAFAQALGDLGLTLEKGTREFTILLVEIEPVEVPIPRVVVEAVDAEAGDSDEESEEDPWSVGDSPGV